MTLATLDGAVSNVPSAPIARGRSYLPQRLRVEVPEVLGDEARARGLALALAALPGVTGATVSALTGRALLHFGAPVEALEPVLRAVADAAAHAEPVEAPPPGAAAEPGEAPLQRDWLRVIAGGAAVAALTLVRVVGGPLALAAPPVAVLATGAALLVGLPTFVSGLRPLLGLRPSAIDTLITTATFASLLLGEGVTGLVVVWLIALGELVEELTLQRTRRAIADLLSVGEEWVWVALDAADAGQAAGAAGGVA